MKDIIIHIGFPKAATTSFQNGLYLLNDEVIYIGKNRMKEIVETRDSIKYDRYLMSIFYKNFYKKNRMSFSKKTKKIFLIFLFSLFKKEIEISFFRMNSL
jgi:hypothetical protein